MMMNQTMIDKAERLIPELFRGTATPRGSIDVIADENALQGWRTKPASEPQAWRGKSFGKGESFVLDFGDHLVGYVSVAVRSTGSPQDAPLKLKLTFGEMPCEVGEPFDSYQGWLSSSWLQEETVFVDVMPAVLKLPRRYSFRYMKVEVIDASAKFKAAFDDIRCETVTSGDLARIEPLPAAISEDLKAMDRIAIKTLQDCMQTVFEDGPKRDRRLWIGDLRLQAQANAYTFRNYDLVKRCLYLFAGMRLEDGAVGGCVFERPHPHVDDTRLYDYALFFVATLHDYYEASRDAETLAELWPIAMEQLTIGLRRLDADGVVADDPSWWCFTDWHDGLNKQAPGQAILIYCLKRGLVLARQLGLKSEEALIAAGIERATAGALGALWDAELGFFVSGEERQVSCASQVWMALAEVLPPAENTALMDRLLAEPPAIGMTTPYMVHHFIEALFLVGRQERAVAEMQAYWGEMVHDGADCFWELYNPEDKKQSPYGSFLINSYCHAWSCTPTYFIRKYLL